MICYCGAEIKPRGQGWTHVETNSKWCYKDEIHLDPLSRCDASPDPDTERAIRAEED